MQLSGPDSAKFEIFAYEQSNGEAVIKVWDDDHLGTYYNGFDINISIPTTSAFSFNDTQTYYKQFEYSHSINPGGATSGNYPYYLILDYDASTITNITSEPTDKNGIEYDGEVWIGINAEDQDTANTIFHDQEVYRCNYNVTGPSLILLALNLSKNFSVFFGIPALSPKINAMFSLKLNCLRSSPFLCK